MLRNGYLFTGILGLVGVVLGFFLFFDAWWHYMIWWFITGGMSVASIYGGWIRYWNYLRGKRNNP
jgi:hypothetical protein